MADNDYDLTENKRKQSIKSDMESILWLYINKKQLVFLHFC